MDGAGFHQVMAAASDEVCYDRGGGEGCGAALLGVDLAGFSTELAPEPSAMPVLKPSAELVVLLAAEPFAELAPGPSAELPAVGSVPLSRTRLCRGRRLCGWSKLSPGHGRCQ